MQIIKSKICFDLKEVEVKTVHETVNFVRNFPDPKNLEAIGNVVFRNSAFDIDEAINHLKESVAYFQKTLDERSMPDPPGKYV